MLQKLQEFNSPCGSVGLSCVLLCQDYVQVKEDIPLRFKLVTVESQRYSVVMLKLIESKTF